MVAAPMLATAGHEVVGLDSGLFDGCNFGELPAPVPELRKDLRDLGERDLEGFDAVVHLAALSNDPLGDLNPCLRPEVNYRASVRLAELAKAAGASRFVFSSSCSTYGAAGDHFLDETAELKPVTAYAESKVRVEREVSRLADDRFSPVYLRNATAYGVSPRLRLDIVLNDLVASAFATGRVLIKSDGTPWRPIVHIEDIMRAVIAVIEAPRAAIHNECFNVGLTEENYRISELAAIVEQTVPGCRIEYAAGGGPDKRCYRVDCGKIRQAVPSFRPQWNARLGARQLYDAYRIIGLTAADLEGTRYIRLRRIRELLAAGVLDASLRWHAAHSAAGAPAA
jgi:nucleoside-diphosphate-sugar epimerase